MRVSRNERLIKQRSRLGTYATLGGLAVLVAGMIASFQVQYLWLSLIALVLGFALSQFGSYYLRRWSRSPRPDQVIEAALKGFDDRYHLYSWSLPSPHVLLSPLGVFTFETRDQTGQISVQGERWHTKFTLGRILLLFGQEGLGNPSRDAAANATRLEKLIEAGAPDTPVKVQPVVVFIDKRAQLSVEDPTVPIMDAESLKKWLRGQGKSETLKNADYRAVENALDERAQGAGAQELSSGKHKRAK